jgi:hypothetical protein
VPLELRATVHVDKSEVEDNRVEDADSELADALRKYKQVKEAHPPYVKDEDEDRPEPIPSLASPKKKWIETTARAEEPPPEFIAKKADTRRSSPSSSSDNDSMEPNPMSINEDSDTDREIKAQRSGKVDVEKEFDEIAAKFNEEMDRAEKGKK